MLNITITPQHSARLDGHENELYALVRVTSSDEHSADLEQSAKPPLNVSLVIDQSGSMQGAPIEAAKGAAANAKSLTRKVRAPIFEPQFLRSQTLVFQQNRPKAAL